ncbi:hypothetical protein SLS57_011914 [Botryosphaeria dothidea]
MASRQGFGGRSNKNSNNQPPQGKGNASPTMSHQAAPQQYPPSQGQMYSPSMAPAAPNDSAPIESERAPSPQNRKPPYFFREEHANLIVKGNFMTLAAKPKMVDEVVEQYRLLDGMIMIIKTVDERTGRPVCNPDTCPTMSAAGHTYTWLDNNKKPIKIPAYQYIQLVQKWIVGKIGDQNLFPTDTSVPSQPSSTSAATYASGGLNTPGSNSPIPAGPTSINAPLSQLSGDEWCGKGAGFPRHFKDDIRSIYRQMMRCYAHLYHGHWLDPFWNLNAYKELNTCFIHFINVGHQYDLLSEKEMEPMMPLIQLWLGKGLLPEKTVDGQPAASSSQPSASQPQDGQAAPAAA